MDFKFSRNRESMRNHRRLHMICRRRENMRGHITEAFKHRKAVSF